MAMVDQHTMRTRGAFPGAGIEPDPLIRAQLAQLGRIGVVYGPVSTAKKIAKRDEINAKLPLTPVPAHK